MDFNVYLINLVDMVTDFNKTRCKTVIVGLYNSNCFLLMRFVMQKFFAYYFVDD